MGIAKVKVPEQRELDMLTIGILKEAFPQIKTLETSNKIRVLLKILMAKYELKD